MDLKKEVLDCKKYPPVKAFIFDVDGTLMDTVKIFIETYEEVEVILKNIFKDKALAKEEFLAFKEEMYAEKGKYKDILDMYVISEKFSKDLFRRGLIREEDRARVEKPMKDIYKKIPDIYPDALDLLKNLKTKGYRISFSTHSGDWGKQKIEYIWNLLGSDSEELIYLSIPLEEEKDSKSWKKIAKMLGLKCNEVVVVGDNPEADIENAVVAGINRCVFVRRKLPGDYKFRGEELYLPEGENYKVWRVSSLLEIEKLF